MKKILMITTLMVSISTASFAGNGEMGYRGQNKESVFQKIDINNDGYISLSEFKKHHEQKISNRKSKKQRGDRIKERKNRIFKAMDKNSDGYITQHELNKFHGKKMNMKDANHDGYITKQEFFSGKKSPHKRGDEIFAKLDKNNDGKLAKKEMKSKAGKRFKAMDVNNDGKISRDEFMAHKPQMKKRNPEEIFKRIDANRDGRISRDEFVNHKPQRRGGGMRNHGEQSQGRFEQRGKY